MKEIKAYQESANNISGDIDDSCLMTIFPSGFKNTWLVAYEEPTYEISVRYLTDEEVKFFKLKEV